jgi:hypothetical protein
LVNPSQSGLDIFLNITKVEGVPPLQSSYSMIQFFHQAESWASRDNEFLGSFYNKTTRGILCPKFLKPKRSGEIHRRARSVKGDGVVIRRKGRNVNQRVFWMQMNSLKRSHASVQPLFNGITALPIVTPSEGIFSTKSIMPKLLMDLLKGQLEELATGLPPLFSDWDKTWLKSPMHSHEPTKFSPIKEKESQKPNLSLLS